MDLPRVDGPAKPLQQMLGKLERQTSLHRGIEVCTAIVRGDGRPAVADGDLRAAQPGLIVGKGTDIQRLDVGISAGYESARLWSRLMLKAHKPLDRRVE